MLAYHITFGTRGFWPPNDPAGGGSEYVWATHLRRFGPAVKVRRRVHRAGSNELRRAIKDAYLYAEVVFTGLQARSVAGGFAAATKEADYRCYAAVVMPNHVHLVMNANHPKSEKAMVTHLKAKATMQMRRDKLWAEEQSPWGRGYWCDYLDDVPQVQRAIRYTVENPIKAGLREQRWPFVVPHPAE